MYFINKPANEFMGIMVLIIIKLSISRSDPGNKAMMVKNSSIAFYLNHVPK
jgi:hypothetical protein